MTQKAVVYVIKDGKLLVFTHDGLPLTRTGVQVPAGTVKPGKLWKRQRAENFTRRLGCTRSQSTTSVHRSMTFGQPAMSEQYATTSGRTCRATRPTTAGVRAKMTPRVEVRLSLGHVGGFRWKTPTFFVRDSAL